MVKRHQIIDRRFQTKATHVLTTARYNLDVSRWCSCIHFEPAMAEHSKVAEVMEVIEGTVAFIDQPKA